MIKNFKKELELINSNDFINEKLMIFSLYNEFYNDILGHADDYFIRYYAPFMEKTFELVVVGLNLKGNISVSAEQFMRIYFQMLKKSRLSSMPQAKGIIKTFENELNSFIEASEYVNVIEKFSSISLDTKVNIMAQFREYINNMFLTTIDLYGEKNSKGLRHNILDILSIKLEEYLKDNLEEGYNENDITNKLKPTMMVVTKDYLMNQLGNGDTSLIDFQDEATKQFFGGFNEIEQKIWLMGAIYIIAGYDRNDKSKDDEKMKEMCELLGISKLKYTIIALSMGIRSIKMMKKAMNEIDTETFDGDLPVKRRK